MKQIKYTDKVNNKGTTPTGIFSANDANEIKNVVNTNAQEVADKYVNKADYALGISGSITTSQTLPQLNVLVDGIYEAQTSGTYANGLIAKVGYYTRFKKTGTVWTISNETEMPDGASLLEIWSTTSLNYPYKINTQVRDGSGKIFVSLVSTNNFPLTDIAKWKPIGGTPLNTLASTSVEEPLSANMGKTLNDIKASKYSRGIYLEQIIKI